MIDITSKNVGRIAERIVANELEARGFRVSDLNKEGVAANADLLAVWPDKRLLVQVKGAANPKVMVDQDTATLPKNSLRQQAVLDRVESFYKADLVVLVRCRSPREYSWSSCLLRRPSRRQYCIGVAFRAVNWPHGKSRHELDPPPRAQESHHVTKERQLLARYRGRQEELDAPVAIKVRAPPAAQRAALIFPFQIPPHPRPPTMPREPLKPYPSPRPSPVYGLPTCGRCDRE